MVDDKTHVWLVDPHAKSNSGHNQLQSACKHLHASCLVEHGIIQLIITIIIKIIQMIRTLS